MTPPTMHRYRGILPDTFMVRALQPYRANLGKRLIESPKIYLRGRGLLHAPLGIETLDDLYGHPVVGASWEGLVIEHLIGSVRDHTAEPYFYRTVAGAELDLVVTTLSGAQAFEAKLGLNAILAKGYHLALADLGIDLGYVVYTGIESYRMARDTQVVGLAEITRQLR